MSQRDFIKSFKEYTDAKGLGIGFSIRVQNNIIQDLGYHVYVHSIMV